MSRTAARRAVAAGGAAVGLVVFAIALRGADASAVMIGVRHIGPGFLLLLLLAGIRQFARAAAWSLCASPTARPAISAAFAGGTVGEALGNLTPFGPFASEPAKIVWVKNAVGSAEAAAALAAETLLYSASVVAVVLIGAVLALFVTPMPASVRHAVIVALTACGVTCAGATALARRMRWSSYAGVAAPAAASRYLVRIREFAARVGWLVTDLASRRRLALALVSLLEIVFQAAAVAEIYVTLVLLGVPRVTLSGAFVLEAVNRIVTIVFKFIPFRLGVDELATGMAASVLGAGTPVGIAVAIVRKGRALYWSLVGLVLILWRVSVRARQPDEHVYRPSAGAGLDGIGHPG